MRYTVKHALVRDTAYGSLLRVRRAQLHARVAAALEGESSYRSNQPEILARHYSEAREIVKAVELRLVAAQRANIRSACAESLAPDGAAPSMSVALKDSRSKAHVTSRLL
jgi:predicted ATPase